MINRNAENKEKILISESSETVLQMGNEDKVGQVISEKYDELNNKIIDNFEMENKLDSTEQVEAKVQLNRFSFLWNIKKLCFRLKDYMYLSAPFFVLTIFLLICSHNVLNTADKENILYPIGDKTISWCDMQQQLVPLFCDFKDVLQGKNSFFFTMKNAGGMNFYAVYMFFLASPFSLLVVFVDKADMTLFMNILVMLKMATAALTSAIYFKHSIKNLSQPIIVALSILYAFSGYIMLYYQNVMWLDMVYMFPLLLLAMEHLVQKGKPLAYSIILALNVYFCFYISYMLVVFVILYFGVTIIRNVDRKKIAINFILGSLVALLLAAIVYIPVLLQYFRSARTSDLIKTLQTSGMATATETIVPSILCLTFLIPFMFAKKTSGYTKTIVILFILTLIPIYIEPINKMWMTGNYMAFPSRYAFITTFLALSIVGRNLEKDELRGFRVERAIGSLIIFSVVGIFSYFSYKFLQQKQETLDAYTDTLWGDGWSFDALIRYYSVVLVVSLLVFLAYKRNLMKNYVFGFVFIVVAITESVFSMNVYMVSPSRGDESYRYLMQTQDAIDDDDFYRVKTPYKLTDVNNIGAIGFNNLGHYTSLTSKDYLFTAKRLGYSSYWMEVGAYGGTYFTDALMSNKYTLYNYASETAEYSFEKYSIRKNNYYMPLGIVSKNDLSNCVELDGVSRGELQESLYNNIFGSTLHTQYTDYELTNIEDNSDEEYFRFHRTNTTNSITYTINVTNKTALYFDAFDVYSNSLSEHINGSFRISINGYRYADNYPSQSSNGVVYLGDYQNNTVTVKVELLKNDVHLNSFGVYGIDLDKLNSTIDNSTYANINTDGSSFTGKVDASDGDYLFIAIPYDSGFSAKINGKSTEVFKTCSGFMAIKLNDGTNDIKLSFTPNGFVGGLIITLLTVVCIVLFFIFRKELFSKFVFGNKLSIVSIIAVFALFIAVIIVIYIMPLLVNFMATVYPPSIV